MLPIHTKDGQNKISFQYTDCDNFDTVILLNEIEVVRMIVIDDIKSQCIQLLLLHFAQTKSFSKKLYLKSMSL